MYNYNYHYLRQVTIETSLEKGSDVIMMEVGEEDHVHLFVSAHPKIALSYIVKIVKGISARKLFLKFPKLKRGYRCPTFTGSDFTRQKDR